MKNNHTQKYPWHTIKPGQSFYVGYATYTQVKNAARHRSNAYNEEYIVTQDGDKVKVERVR